MNDVMKLSADSSFCNVYVVHKNLRLELLRDFLV